MMFHQAAVVGALRAGVLLVVASSPAAAAGLFEPATSTETRAAATRAPPTTPEVMRHRLVRLNAGELARHVVPAGADVAANRLQRAKGLDGLVDIELFPNLSVSVRRTDIEAPDDGGYIWSGAAAGLQPGSVTLVIINNKILGRVQVGARLFSIEPVTGAVHRMTEIDQNKIPGDVHLPNSR